MSRIKSVFPSMVALSLTLWQYPLSVQANNIDFASSDKSTTAGGSASIVVDGAPVQINAGDKVTYGEAAAVSQVLSGVQTIVLGAGGVATGGTVNLSQVGATMTGVNIPQGLTAIHDFGNSALNLSGSFVNSGNFYGVSTNQSVTMANILASNLTNNSSALLTTVLPQGGLAGFSNLVANLGLNLTVTNTLMNAGTISSAGSFSATAANMVNTGLMNSASSMNLQALSMVNSGLIAAQSGNLNVVASTLANTGTLQSVLGNLQMHDLLNNSLLVDNKGGLLSAGNDLIFEILGTSPIKPELTVLGGVLQAGTDGLTKFDAKDGHLNIDVQDMGGKLSFDAGSMSLTINAGTTAINVIHSNITGDPDIIVTAPSYTNGNLLTLGGKVDITATGGDITVADIDTTNAGIGSAAGSVSLNANGNITTGNILTGNAPGASAPVTLTATGFVTTGSITAPGQTAQISAGGNITLNYPTGGDLSATPLNFIAGGTVDVNATTGGFTLGNNSLTSTGAGALNVNANAGTLSFLNGTIVTTNGPAIFNGNTIDLSGAGALVFNTQGSVGTGFQTSTALRAANGFTWPGTLSLTFNGSGGEISDFAPVTNLGGTGLNIVSAGDIDIAVDTFINTGAVTMRVPNTAAYVAQISSFTSTPSFYNDIQLTGGLLALISDGRMTISGNNKSIGPNFGSTGGFVAFSGAFTPNQPNTQTGIVVTGGASIFADHGSVGLFVNNQSSPPADSSVPSILIQPNALVTSYGYFLAGKAGPTDGGGIQITVNSFVPGGLNALILATRPTLDVAGPTGNITVNGAPSVPGPLTMNGLTLIAGSSGLVVVDENGGATPGLLGGTGMIQSNGGITYISGASYVGEIQILGGTNAFVDYFDTTPAPPPPPPGPPVVPPVVVGGNPPGPVNNPANPGPAAGGGGGGGAQPPQATVLSTDTTSAPVNATQTASVPQARDAQPIQLTTPQANTRAAQVVLNPCSIVEMQPPDNIKFKHIKEPPMLVTFDETQMSLLPPSASDEKSNRLGVQLETGRMMIVTSASSCSVMVQCPGRPLQSIEVPKNSSVVIERRSNGALAVASLEGPAASVSLYDSSNSEDTKKVIPINPNTNLVMASDEEELIPVEGDCECAVGASLRLEIKDSPGLVAQTREIKDRKKFLYRGTGDCFVTDSRDRDVQRIQKKMKEIEAALPAPGGARKNPLSPVAYTVPANAPPAPVKPTGKTILSSNRRFDSLPCPNGSIKTSPDAVVNVEQSGVVKLTSGELLYCADKHSTLKINDAEIKVRRGAMILVNATKDHLSIINLWENGIKDVHVVVAGSKIELASGHQILLIEKGQRPLDVLKGQSLARREIKINTFQQGRNLVTADVSLQTALYQCTLLRSVATSSDAECRKIRDRVVKMAAALTMSTAGHGGYQFSGLK